MSPVADSPVMVPERELEEDKKRPSESEPPRIRCPLCGWSPRKEDKWFCTCGHEWNTSIQGECAPPASISGLKRSAFSAVDGHGTHIGMRGDLQIATITRPGFTGRSTNS